MKFYDYVRKVIVNNDWQVLLALSQIFGSISKIQIKLEKLYKYM
jgi:hypothetical protein